MKPYLEDRNGTQYEFEMTRKLFVKEAQKAQNIKQDLTALEDICYDILNNKYPELTKEQFDDILDYNASLEGNTQLYELLGAIVESVFTQVDSEKKEAHNLFLQEYRAKKEQEKIQE